MQATTRHSPIRNQRGAALVATLGIAMLLLPLGGFALLRCRTNALIQRNLRRDVEAFYAAEAGLAHGVAQMKQVATFAQVLAGPDRIAGTPDDGALSLGGVVGQAVPAPLQLQLRAEVADTNLLRLASLVIGPGGPVKTLEALVALTPTPFTPAALHVTGDASAIEVGSRAFLFSGLDHDITDVLGAATGSPLPIGALNASDPAAAPLLRQRLGAVAAQLSGTGGSPSVTSGDAVDIAAMATTLAGHPTRVDFPQLVVDASIVLGAAAAPQLSLIHGDCDVAGHLESFGVLVVQGLLRVTGELRVSGLLVVLGGVVFEPASSVEVRGALWRGPSTDVRLQFDGQGGIAYSSQGLELAERAVPSVLPHATHVVGWREQL